MAIDEICANCGHPKALHPTPYACEVCYCGAYEEARALSIAPDVYDERRRPAVPRTPEGERMDPKGRAFVMDGRAPCPRCARRLTNQESLEKVCTDGRRYCRACKFGNAFGCDRCDGKTAGMGDEVAAP